MPRYSTKYENLRENLNPGFRRLSDRRIEAELSFRGIDAEMAEGFFDDLGKIASKVGKVVVSAAPSILPIAGTVVGGAFGGPLGASLGGTLGRFAGGAIGAATGSGGAGPAPGPPGSPAAGQLLQTMVRPETLNALMSMFLGPAGRPNVNVGSTPVPVGAFGNLLGVLANRAAAEYNAATVGASEYAPAYMRDFAGDAVGDPAVAAHRADALYELLEANAPDQESEAAEQVQASEAAAEAYEAAYEASEAAEAWELMELLETFDAA